MPKRDVAPPQWNPWAPPFLAGPRTAARPATDGALALLQAFASNRSLQRLDLAGNPIEPYALEALNFACRPGGPRAGTGLAGWQGRPW